MEDDLINPEDVVNRLPEPPFALPGNFVSETCRKAFDAKKRLVTLRTFQLGSFAAILLSAIIGSLLTHKPHSEITPPALTMFQSGDGIGTSVHTHR
ncbi:MAG: hypothetical protein P1V20_23895 [Verrucomicrobiales bacterium]|nr:hypothetical protein [Verrucomicrobiales bacterium]